MGVKCFAKEKKREAKKRKQKIDQTRFSSFNDFIFDPLELPPAPFRSLKYSIGTMAKKKVKQILCLRLLTIMIPMVKEEDKINNFLFSKAKRQKAQYV
jgi:hypothetical protein